MTKKTSPKPASGRRPRSQPTPKAPRQPGQLTLLRKRVGLSLQDVAIETGAERSTVFRWEKGEREPEPRFRRAYAAALKVTLGQLGQFIYEDRARR